MKRIWTVGYCPFTVKNCAILTGNSAIEVQAKSFCLIFAWFHCLAPFFLYCCMFLQYPDSPNFAFWEEPNMKHWDDEQHHYCSSSAGKWHRRKTHINIKKTYNLFLFFPWVWISFGLSVEKFLPFVPNSLSIYTLTDKYLTVLNVELTAFLLHVFIESDRLVIWDVNEWSWIFARSKYLRSIQVFDSAYRVESSRLTFLY